MEVKNIFVVGAGLMGSGIAQTAIVSGFKVTLNDQRVEALDRAHDGIAKNLNREVEKGRMSQEDCDAAIARLSTSASMQPAKDADLVIEAIAEDPKQKDAFYAELAKYLPESTILVTNSSTLLPSQIAASTGRPEKFLALHFANRIWRNNTAEVMGHPGTDQAAYDEVVRFAADLGMVPLQLHKEQPGYILNSMLVPFLNAAEALYATGVADPETIDKTWMLGTGAPLGPFRILDIVGLTTAYNIVVLDPRTKDPDSVPAKIAAALKERIDAGKTGVDAGEGFYRYN